MALIDGGRPHALTLLKLLGLRVLVLVLASAPALLAGLLGVAGEVARRPYYTDIEGRLPVVHVLRLSRELPPGLAPAALVSVLLSVLADQVLTGGALSVLDPARPRSEPPAVLATVARDGLSRFWAFLRAAGLGALISAVGAALLRLPLDRLDIRGYREGWTGETLLLLLPMLSAGVVLLWLSTVGAWVFWCRLLTAADGRRRVVRTGELVLRVFYRRSIRTLGAFVTMTLAPTLASGAVLLAWRHAEPGGVAGALSWFLGWLLTVVLQAISWLWLLRSGRLLYAGDGFADLRSTPDERYRPLAALQRRWRRRADGGRAVTTRA